MLQKLKTLFAAPGRADEALEPRLQLAAAALLIELGKADYKRDAREYAAITDAVRTTFKLSAATVDELLREAESASAGATSLYEFTSLINAHFSEAEKFRLIRQLWRVAGADGNIDKYEDHLIRKIAELLYVPHAQFIRAKLEVLGA